MATDPTSALTAQFPHQAIHLTDTTALPILSSTKTEADLVALTSLTQTYLQATETAARLGLGIPNRITVETAKGGPVVVQSSIIPLPPQSTLSTPALKHPSPAPGRQDPENDEPEQLQAPTLVATVIAPSAAEMAELRLAAWSVENVGRKFQKAWLAEQEELLRSGRNLDDDDGEEDGGVRVS